MNANCCCDASSRLMREGSGSTCHEAARSTHCVLQCRLASMGVECQPSDHSLVPAESSMVSDAPLLSLPCNCELSVARHWPAHGCTNALLASSASPTSAQQHWHAADQNTCSSVELRDAVGTCGKLRYISTDGMHGRSNNRFSVCIIQTVQFASSSDHHEIKELVGHAYLQPFYLLNDSPMLCPQNACILH
jgi:hypothetical protein